MDKKTAKVDIKPTSINELLEVILKRIKPLAEQRNIEMIFESYRPVTAEVDQVKLSLAFSNLIENAVKYNVDDGSIIVSLNADHKYFYVKVADTGVGIPEDCQDQVYERFYRVDKARSRKTGGTGLGLAITRNAILVHKGAIKLYSKEGEGTTFTVRIPLNYHA
jgi:signal transduction histidine kinase